MGIPGKKKIFPTYLPISKVEKIGVIFGNLLKLLKANKTHNHGLWLNAIQVVVNI
jgi:hypothetical protein